MPAKGKSIVKLIPEEVISYYSNHSKTFTQKHFGASWPRIEKILIDNGIKLHTKGENQKLSIKEMSGGDTKTYYENKKKKFQNTISSSDNFKENRTNKIKATKKEKYGENYNSIINQKAADTRREKYGTADMFHSEKANQTKLEKYDDINYNNRKKCAETKLKNFGDPNYNNREKCAETKLNNWGNATYVNPQKMIATKREKYDIWPGAGKTIYYDNGVEFDSLPELALWRYAKDHNEEIVRTPIRFKYECCGKEHYCYPDFLYKGELIEIKGPHLINSEGILTNPYFIGEGRELEDERLRLKTETLLNNNVRFMLCDEYIYYVDWFNQHYDKNTFKIEKES